MIQPSAVERNVRLLRFLEAEASTLIIDADTHATNTANLAETYRTRHRTAEGYYHGRPVSAEDLVAEMDMASVNMALTWNNPSSTLYDPSDEEFNYQSLLAANRYILCSAGRFPRRFLPAGWTDPRALGLDGALKLVDFLVLELGLPIVKMNPAQNRFPIDSEPVFRIVDRIVSLGAVPAFHFGADTEFTPARGLEAIARRHPGSPVIGVHMGGGGAGYVEAEALYHEARQMGLQLPNLCYIFSALRDTHIEEALITYQLAGAPYRNNLFCGSDAPYGRMCWNFGGFRAMLYSLLNGAKHTDPRLRANPKLFSPDDVQKYLGGNFARFYAGAIRALLTRHGVDPGPCNC